MSWQPTEGTATVDGVVYGGKHAEFGKVINLPRRTSQVLELAIGGGLPPIDLLRQHGWQVIEGYAASSDPLKYREYICTSKAEFSVAKHAYVATRSGWFSCRSACYLAAGKPVVVQDTGFSEYLPTGEGIWPSRQRMRRSTPSSASIGIISATQPPLTRLAREFFDAERVLRAFLDTALA